MDLLPQKSPETIGLIGHTIINYPNRHASQAIIDILANNKVDLIELQIPFSEPIADGPIFAKANHDTIASGTTVADCYDFMAEMTSRYALPFVFMTYANIVFRQGFTHFVKTAKQAGAKGAIIPDLPLDKALEYERICQEEDFYPIAVIPPNISTERLTALQPHFAGFIYAVARAGVTGAATKLDDGTIQFLTTLKQYSHLPIAVGFGIASGKDLNFLRGYADYAVIGTQTVRAYHSQGLEGVNALWQELKIAADLTK